MNLPGINDENQSYKARTDTKPPKSKDLHTETELDDQEEQKTPVIDSKQLNPARTAEARLQRTPFSSRLLSGLIKIDPKDVHAVANQMLFEINLTAGRLLVLHHKLIHVLKIVPRFVSELL